MNLGNLIEACEFRSGQNDPDYRPQWKNFLNEGIREFSRKQPWPGLEDLITVVTDGTEYLVLPHYVDTIVGVLNASFHHPVERSGDWDRSDPSVYSQRTTGRVVTYDPVGRVATLRDPTGYLFVKSTHASDAQTVWITGMVNNSGASGTALQKSLSHLSVSLTGTSPLTLTTLFAQIISISKTTDANGDLYFYDAGATNAHIAYMGRYDDESAFNRFQLMMKPDTATSLRIRFRYKIPPLKDNSQSPHPSVHPDFVISHAISLFHKNNEQYQKAAVEAQRSSQVMLDEANKELNFNEPHSIITPYVYPVEDDSPFISDLI